MSKHFLCLSEVKAIDKSIAATVLENNQHQLIKFYHSYDDYVDKYRPSMGISSVQINPANFYQSIGTRKRKNSNGLAIYPLQNNRYFFLSFEDSSRNRLDLNMLKISDILFSEKLSGFIALGSHEHSSFLLRLSSDHQSLEMLYQWNSGLDLRLQRPKRMMKTPFYYQKGHQVEEIIFLTDEFQFSSLRITEVKDDEFVIAPRELDYSKNSSKNSVLLPPGPNLDLLDFYFPPSYPKNKRWSLVFCLSSRSNIHFLMRVENEDGSECLIPLTKELSLECELGLEGEVVVEDLQIHEIPFSFNSPYLLISTTTSMSGNNTYVFVIALKLSRGISEFTEELLKNKKKILNKFKIKDDNRKLLGLNNNLENSFFL